MTHVLVTGAAGYLGSVLVPALLASDRVTKVTALGRKRGSIDPNPGIFPLLPSKPLIFATADDLVSGRIAAAGVDMVCHLAAGRDAATPADVAAGLEFTGALIAWASAAKVQGFINASSQAVYGTEDPPWREGMPVAPVTAYGMAKYASELMLENASLMTSSLKTTSLRLAKLVGPSPRFRIAPSEPPYVFAHAALTGKTLNVPINGYQQLDLMDVRDAAEVIVRLIEMPTANWRQVMNVGSGKQATLREIAELVSTIAVARYGKRLMVNFDDSIKAGGRNFGMDTTRLEDIIQWKSSCSLQKSVEDVLALVAQRMVPGMTNTR